MQKICFICDRCYEVGDGMGELAHFAFQHGLVAPKIHNGRNLTGELMQVVEQGPTGDTWDMRFGDTIQPGDGSNNCAQPGCGARMSRGYYCARHGSA